MKIAVITAVIGDIDQVKIFPEQSMKFEQHFFTEPPEGITGNDRMKALYYKCRMHRLGIDADVFIWIDGKVQPVAHDFIERIIAALGDNDIAVLKHHERDCIYKEIDHIEHCMKKGNQYLLARYKNKPIRRQVDAYMRLGYPVNNGLFDCCIIAMHNNDRIREVSDSWWKEVYHMNGFDQVALPFCAWKKGLKIQPINFKRGVEFNDVPHLVLK